MSQVVTLLWIWKLSWNWAYHGENVSPWAAQFAFGFYSVMLTSTVLGFGLCFCLSHAPGAYIARWER